MQKLPQSTLTILTPNGGSEGSDENYWNNAYWESAETVPAGYVQMRRMQSDDDIGGRAEMKRSV